MPVSRRSPESLEKAYAHLGARPEEPLADDTPLDVIAGRAASDPWYWGKWAAIRLVGFLKMLNKQTAAITPRHLVFAIELTALNFYFSHDPELDPARVKAARLAAQAHYKKHEHDA